MFIKDRPLKGQSEAEFYDASRAAEIDAADALNKDRIPRIYRKGVKQYFDRLGDRFRPKAADKDSEEAEQADESDTKGRADDDGTQEQGGAQEQPEQKEP